MIVHLLKRNQYQQMNGFKLWGILYNISTYELSFMLQSWFYLRWDSMTRVTRVTRDKGRYASTLWALYQFSQFKYVIKTRTCRIARLQTFLKSSLRSVCMEIVLLIASLVHALISTMAVLFNDLPSINGKSTLRVIV